MLSASGFQTKRNTSGVVGVNRTEYLASKRGRKYRTVQWQTHWPDANGRIKTRSFSILKYGENEAFRLAVKAREDGLAALKHLEHAVFLPPANLSQKVWRYMDFTKFISLLEESALFFSCVDLLNDPFEGSFSKLNKELRPLIHKGQDLNATTDLLKQLRQEVAVSCWHISDYESAAMWELYGKSEEAVCIQSTYQKLRKSFNGKAKIGAVQYVDYTDDFIPESDPYLAFLHKRKSFEHEREIRGIIKKVDESNQGNGTLIKVELSDLIENVYVSPNTPEWFFELIQKSIVRYGLKTPVIQSSLDDDPVF